MGRMVATLLVVVFALPSTAAADADDRWLVLPTSSRPNDAWVVPTSKMVSAELSTQGVDAWSLTEAAAQFETAGSATAAEVSDGDIQRWVEQSSNAIRNLAEGDYTRALSSLNEAQALSREAAEALNREHDRAKRTLDTCLYMVRVLLDTGTESRARAMAMECRQLVPRVQPTQHMHPPQVRQLLEQVDESRAGKALELEVDSQPTDCTVRVNGVVLGKTPLSLKELFPAEYRVQVECEPGRRGRVHTVNLATSSASLFVDARFDRTVSTESVLFLRYDDAKDESRYRFEHAAIVERAVPARGIVFVSKPANEVLQLELAGGSPLARIAVARIDAGEVSPTPQDVALAVKALVDAQCTDFTSGEPVPVVCSDPTRHAQQQPEGWPLKRMPRRTFKAGMVFVGLGTGALVTGYLLLLPTRNAANDWLDALPSGRAQNKWIRYNNAILWTSGIGATFLVTAMPMVLPKHEGVPWGAWLSGALGVGALAFSLGYGLSGDRPPDSCRGTTPVADRGLAEACITRAERVSAAFLAGVTAGPLLTIPLVYLLRRSDKKLEPRVAVSRSMAYVGMGGSW